MSSQFISLALHQDQDTTTPQNTLDAPNHREMVMIILIAPHISLPKVKLVDVVVLFSSLSCHSNLITDLVRRI
jgi:hypothetical protein